MNKGCFNASGLGTACQPLLPQQTGLTDFWQTNLEFGGVRPGKDTQLLLALFYGLALAALPLMAFKDRANYLVYAEHSTRLLLGFAQKGLLALLANEPVWLIINTVVGLFLTPEATLRAVIFLSAFAVAYLLLRADPKNWVWLLFFLVMPQVLKNHIIHLRQGMAIAVFLLGWCSRSKRTQWIFIGLSPFIHASFFFVLALNGLNRTMRWLTLAADVRSLVYLAIAINIGVGLGTIANWLGARQAQQYVFSATDVSGLGFLFWLFVSFLFGLQGHSFLARHALAFGGIVFYLGTYFICALSARIFESMLPLVLLAGLQLTGWRRKVFLGAILGYGVLNWAMKFTHAVNAS